MLYLGLQEKLVRVVESPEQLKFPENQHDIEELKRDIKYLKLISSSLPQTNRITGDDYICVAELKMATTALKQII